MVGRQGLHRTALLAPPVISFQDTVSDDGILLRAQLQPGSPVVVEISHDFIYDETSDDNTFGWRFVPLDRTKTWLVAAVFFLGTTVAIEDWTTIKHLVRVLRDDKGRDEQSISRTNQVSNPAPGDVDFAARCDGPGVVKCVGFDSRRDIAGIWGDRSGILPGKSPPVIDTAVKASGDGSLKFTVPMNSSANSSASYFTNFSNDLSIQFDSGQEFYVQWRQRFSPEFVDPGAEWKQAIIGEGDRPGCTSSSFKNCAASCTTLEVVAQNISNRKFPRLYHSCGGKDGQYEGLYEPVPPDDFLFQNGIRNPGCLYHLVNSAKPYMPPCVGYKPNQWMTFQVHIKVGTWYRNDKVYRHDSTLQLWVAEEGKPSVLVIDYSPKDPACQQRQVSQPDCQTGYDLVNDRIDVAKYGKIWLLPYSGSSVFPLAASTWYD